MWFIGDVHGSFRRYTWITNKMQRPKNRTGLDCSLQIGDMGFYNERDFCSIPITPQHKFFRGNHDNPGLCRQHPNYLGDHGYYGSLGMYWLAGGYSIDIHWNRERIQGLTWWEDEQLDHQTLQQCIDDYAAAKPRILVSHECPTEIKTAVLANIYKLDPGFIISDKEFHSHTEYALQAMLDIHRPEVHIFGHYHFKFDVQQSGTRFVGLGDHRADIYDQIFEVPDLVW